MKKILVVFALFAALIFVVSCGSGSKSVNQNDEPDTGETVTDGDTADSESSDTDPSDSGHENPDTTPEQPDNVDSQPDDTDTTPDGGDTEPDNDYPQTPCDPNPCISDANSTGVCTINNNSYVCGCIDGYIFDGTLCIKSLPECSPSSDTPCVDSATGLIWSAKSENKMPWNDALNYCQNLTEGDFNDWRLPSIAVLKTLVQNCSSAKCTEDYTGKYSKFGDTVYLWSSSEGEDSTAKSIYFSDAGTYSVSIDTNVNVRCVRRETESRQVNCTGLIENSVWNTATQITQNWNWDWGWTPSSIASYNTDASTSECRFKCDSSSFRYDFKCVNPCKPNQCTRIGETGICVGISANEYTCECKENYFWNGSSHCLNPCEPNPCTSIGETGICIGKSANEYQCECEDNYVWNSKECIKTCQNTPCNIPNSTGICNQITEIQYACECENNYYWLGTEKGCQDIRPTLGNICTGQTSCYDTSSSMTCPTLSSANFFGQDAYYANLSKCIPQSFTVQTISNQRVVVDNNTGLMWQQTIPTDEYKQEDAVSYCNTLNYAGYSDWRLPNTQELLTIVDNSTYEPAINTTYFPNTPSGGFWSSYIIYGSIWWSVDFFNGGLVPYFDRATSLVVRCVRGESLSSSTFKTTTVKKDVIVTDTKTGLIWQKTYETDKTWQAALDYCENLTYAGYFDWRLPNKNELASLLYNNFPNTPSANFWSSSTDVSSTSSAWYVDFTGSVDDVSKTYNDGFVRCVR